MNTNKTQDNSSLQGDMSSASAAERKRKLGAGMSCLPQLLQASSCSTSYPENIARMFCIQPVENKVEVETLPKPGLTATPTTSSASASDSGSRWWRQAPQENMWRGRGVELTVAGQVHSGQCKTPLPPTETSLEFHFYGTAHRITYNPRVSLFVL